MVAYTNETTGLLASYAPKELSWIWTDSSSPSRRSGKASQPTPRPTAHSCLEIEGTRAVITGSSYEAFNAVFSVDPAPLAAIEKLVGLCRDAGAPVLWHIWPRAGEQTRATPSRTWARLP
jgi:hypothetical protein